MGIPAFFRSAGAGDEAEGWNLDVLHWMLGDELEMKLWMVQRDRPEGRDVGESSQEAWDAVEMAYRETMRGVGVQIGKWTRKWVYDTGEGHGDSG